MNEISHLELFNHFQMVDNVTSL